MSWAQLVENEEDGKLVLPPQQRTTTDEKGGFVERSFIKNEETGEVIMRERHGRINSTDKKVAKAVNKRKQEWIKFGRVENQGKGFIDDGITAVRTEPTNIEWIGDKQLPKSKTFKKLPPTKAKYIPKIPSRDSLIRDRPLAPHLQDETFEMKIGNLPRDIERNHVRVLVNEFYDKVLRMNLPKNMHIKTFHVGRDEETWAVVQFQFEEHRDKAIEYFDGKKFQYQLLSAEKKIKTKTTIS